MMLPAKVLVLLYALDLPIEFELRRNLWRRLRGLPRHS